MPIREDEPLLICELGLHGEGDINYYKAAVDTICSWWTGWPPIAIKTQQWTPGEPFDRQVQEAQGRSPLACMAEFDHKQLLHYCHDRGLVYGVTFHDAAAVFPWAGELDFVKCKLSTPPEVWQAVLPLAKRIVATVDYAEALPAVWRLMSGWDGCPNNHSYYAYRADTPRGYSCHAVPDLAMTYAVDAANGWGDEGEDCNAQTIEVHVTRRPASARPLPADMCVSLSMNQFRKLATRIGRVWSR